jgi:adenylosuccinate synthase
MSKKGLIDMVFFQPGKISFVLGGQFGSEGKGAACAYLAAEAHRHKVPLSIVTTNAGVQSGHTSVHEGVKRVLFHLPTAAVVLNDIANRNPMSLSPPAVYLNAGSIIDPDVLRKELEDTQYPLDRLFIHPNAAVITDDCKDAEMRSDSAQTKIASTRKGVGEALARKVLRSGQIARDHAWLCQFVRRIDLNERLAKGATVLAEVPQGFSLSLNGPFYPHTTSRDCTVGQALSDAGVHPHFYGNTMLVLRTFPIRVGHIKAEKDTPDNLRLGDDHGHFELLGYSGGAYPGQNELSWSELGQTPEITTVTKRIRRVFEFSEQQVAEAMASARPSHVFLAFCDYLKTNVEELRIIDALRNNVVNLGLTVPELAFGYGPSTADVHRHWLPRAEAKL